MDVQTTKLVSSIVLFFITFVCGYAPVLLILRAIKKLRASHERQRTISAVSLITTSTDPISTIDNHNSQLGGKLGPTSNSLSNSSKGQNLTNFENHHDHRRLSYSVSQASQVNQVKNQRDDQNEQEAIDYNNILDSRWVRATMFFGGGVLLATAFCHLIPETHDNFGAYLESLVGAESSPEHEHNLSLVLPGNVTSSSSSMSASNLANLAMNPNLNSSLNLNLNSNSSKQVTAGDGQHLHSSTKNASHQDHQLGTGVYAHSHGNGNDNDDHIIDYDHQTGTDLGHHQQHLQQPHSHSHTHEHSSKIPYVEIAVCCGFFFIYLVEQIMIKFLDSHSHESASIDDSIGHGGGNGDVDDHDDQRQRAPPTQRDEPRLLPSSVGGGDGRNRHKNDLANLQEREQQQQQQQQQRRSAGATTTSSSGAKCQPTTSTSRQLSTARHLSTGADVASGAANHSGDHHHNNIGVCHHKLTTANCVDESRATTPLGHRQSANYGTTFDINTTTQYDNGHFGKLDRFDSGRGRDRDHHHQQHHHHHHNQDLESRLNGRRQSSKSNATVVQLHNSSSSNNNNSDSKSINISVVEVTPTNQSTSSSSSSSCPQPIRFPANFANSDDVIAFDADIGGTDTDNKCKLISMSYCSNHDEHGDEHDHCSRLTSASMSAMNVGRKKHQLNRSNATSIESCCSSSSFGNSGKADQSNDVSRSKGAAEQQTTSKETTTTTTATKSNNNKTNSEVFKFLRGLIIVSAFSAHALFDGVTIGSQQTNDNVWAIFLAISCHKLPVAMIVGLELFEATFRSNLWTCVHLSAFAIMSPIGIWLVVLAQNEFQLKEDDPVMILLQAFATGTILYIVFIEILQPKAHRNDANRNDGIIMSICLILGFVFMLAILTQIGHGE